MKVYGQLESAQAENLTDDPTNLPEGRLWLNQTTKFLKTVINGVKQVFVFEDQVQTLTNKSIDGDDNTLTDISLPSLKTDLPNANKVLRRDAAGIVVSDKIAPSGDFVGTSDTQTLSHKTFSDATAFQGALVGAFADSTTAGANQTITLPTTLVVNLTGALTSLSGIAAANRTQPLILTNQTGADSIVKNLSGAALAADQIITGTDADLAFKAGASLWLIYDTKVSKWRIVGGTGGGQLSQETEQTIANAGTITVALSKPRQVIPVLGSGGAATVAALPFGSLAGVTDPIEILLVNTTAENTLVLMKNDADYGCVGNFDTIEIQKDFPVKCVYVPSKKRIFVSRGI
ncbi:hypothetical protein D3C87_125030 [compost metagenome]